MTIENKDQSGQTKKERRAELHKLTTSQRKNRGQTEGEKREAYRKYSELKKKVFELEKRNNNQLIFYRSSDFDVNPRKFYNISGNSAVIYCCDIGPKLKRKPTLREDLDGGGVRFTLGTCSVLDMVTLEKKLKEMGIRRLPEKEEGMIIFKLNRIYTTEEIIALANSDKVKYEKLNALIYSQVLYPEIYKIVLELKRIVPPKVKNINREYREMFGMEMIRPLRRLSLVYLRMTEGSVTPEDGGEQMMLDISAMLDMVSLFNELKLWDVVTCIRISQSLAQLKQIIRGKVLSGE